jgi:methylase of polypeptide subunit release factors
MRLKIQHIFLLNTDGLHKAPLPEGLQTTLDVGTGTGEWATAIVDRYPSAVVTAIDISPNVLIPMTMLATIVSAGQIHLSSLQSFQSSSFTPAM